MKMKKLGLILVCMTFLTSFAVADRSTAISYMQLAVDTVADFGFTLESYGEGDSWFCWPMIQRQSKEIQRMFFRGNDYILFATGDDSSSDVDIEVYDENWNLVARDSTTEKSAAVNFSPMWSGTFYIRTTCYTANGTSWVGFFVAYSHLQQ